MSYSDSASQYFETKTGQYSNDIAPLFKYYGIIAPVTPQNVINAVKVFKTPFAEKLFVIFHPETLSEWECGIFGSGIVKLAMKAKKKYNEYSEDKETESKEKEDKEKEEEKEKAKKALMVGLAIVIALVILITIVTLIPK